MPALDSLQRSIQCSPLAGPKPGFREENARIRLGSLESLGTPSGVPPSPRGCGQEDPHERPGGQCEEIRKGFRGRDQGLGRPAQEDEASGFSGLEREIEGASGPRPTRAPLRPASRASRKDALLDTPLVRSADVSRRAYSWVSSPPPRNCWIG